MFKLLNETVTICSQTHRKYKQQSQQNDGDLLVWTKITAGDRSLLLTKNMMENC